MYDQILREIASDTYYANNFPNDGQRFVAWYLRRVLLMDVHETRAAITDGQNDKQIDAIVVEDGDDRRVRVIQGKFIKPSSVDATPVREVLSAWERLRDLPTLQLECSGKLAERLETMRLALEAVMNLDQSSYFSSRAFIPRMEGWGRSEPGIRVT
jgi:hypothetical protein